MRVSTFTTLALLATVSFAPVQAVAAPGYACQLAEVYECVATTGCKKATGHGLPPAVTLNVKEKNLFSGLFGGEGLLQNGDVYEDENVLILHGRKDLQTWTAVVNKVTGEYAGSVSQLGKTYAQFGTCDLPTE